MNWFRKNKWQALLLAGLVLVSYINTWGAEFVADDVYGIVNNPNIGDFSKVFSNPVMFFRPLYYWLIYHAFGKQPAGFRFLNIISHMGMSVAVFALVKKMVNKNVGLMVGVLMAVHPIMVESVTWISGGGHSNYALMLVLSMLFYIKNKKFYWWSVGFFLLALGFSEKAVSFPGILVMYEWLFGKIKQNWKKLLPFFGLSGIWAGLNLAKIGARHDYLAETFNNSIQERRIKWWVQAPVALTEYLKLILWPDKLTLYHSEMFFSKLGYWLRAGLIGGLGLASIWAWVKGKKQIVFWLSWFLIGLLVTLLPLGVAWIVAERYVYFSSVGVLVLMAMLVDFLTKKEKMKEGVMIGFGLIVCLLVIRTWVRNYNWRTADSLYLSAKRTSPHSPQNNNNLGDYYGRVGDLKASEWHFKRAIEINPDYADAMHNLGNVYAVQGKFEEAKKWYQKALENKPSLWQSEKQIEKIDQYLNNF